MQVLFKLILTYNIYFVCVFYELLNFPKPRIFIRAFGINVPNDKHNIIVSITDSNNEPKSMRTCRFGLFNNLKCSSNERHYYPDIYLRSCHRSIQRFMTDKPKVQNRTLLSLQRYCKSAIRNFHLYSQMDADMIYRRKLLGYQRNLFNIHPTINSRFQNRIRREITLAETSGLTERKRNPAAKDIESNDEDIDSAAWDNWSIWSACSVTCGQGRQVRWRHCLSTDCIEGLKKAQLRSCRLKDCIAKGFLGWLGIKS